MDREGEGFGVGEVHLVLQTLGIEFFPFFEGEVFAAFGGVSGAIVFDAFDVGADAGVVFFDFDDEASAVFAPDDEVWGVGAPFAIDVLVFDGEIGLSGIGEGTGEIEIIDFIGAGVALFEKLLEVGDLGGGVEIVGRAVEGETVGIVVEEVLEMAEEVFLRFGIGDASSVAGVAIGIITEVEAFGFDKGEGDFDFFGFGGVVGGLGFDLLGEGGEMGERDVAIWVKLGELAFEGEEGETEGGSELGSGGVEVDGFCFGGDLF